MEKTNVPGVYKYVSQKRLYRKQPDVCFYIMFRDSAGKVCREKVGWLSEKYTIADAVRVRAERIHAVRHGDELPREKPEIPFFTTMADEYLEWLKVNKPRSYDADLSRYNKHLKMVFEGKRLDDVTRQDLEDLKTSLVKDYSPQTIKHVLTLFRRIVNKAITWDRWSGPNPIRKIDLPKLNNARLRFLSFEEAKALLTALKAKSVNIHDMALLSLHCGLRLSEILNLKAQDIDIENRIIHILDPKNSETRQAHMTDMVFELLKKRMPKGKDGYIFIDRQKSQVRFLSHTFDRVVTELKLNEGIEDARHKVVFHTLRHTFASWLALQGESPFVIQKLMGHKSLSMTERYSHLAPSASKAAVATLEKTFNERKGTGDNIV